MSAISVLYRFTKISHDDISRVEAMNQEMHYRAINGCDTWHDDVCALAHCHFSTIGDTSVKQPLFNHERDMIIVADSAIYNYKELKKIMQDQGVVFDTDTDAEVILNLYRLKGKECLSDLIGQFAFAIYDLRNHSLFVARDRFGEKQLYFAQLPTGYVFSTELKAICNHFIEKPQLDIKPLAESIRHNYPLDKYNTLIRQIKRVQTAQYMYIDSAGMTCDTYWSRDYSPTFKGTKEEAKKRVIELFREAVHYCMVTNEPIAFALSGGIDSSTVVSFASEQKSDINVISVGYKGKPAVDERHLAKRYADQKNWKFHDIELSEDDFQSYFNQISQFIDEPMSDVSSMSQYAMYNRIHDLGYKVLLNGYGGDELFYGEDVFNDLAQTYRLKREFGHLLPIKSHKLDYFKFIRKNWRYVLQEGHPHRISDKILTDWTYDDYMKFAHDAKVRFGNEVKSFEGVDVHLSFPEDVSEELIYQFFIDNFTTYLLFYLDDRLGAPNALESRSPFFYHKLVEFIDSLPKEIKYEDSKPKTFLKYCLRGIVPDEILDMKKKAFAPPFNFIHWMAAQYKYSHIQSAHCFFNTMIADKVLDNLMKK